MKLAAASTARGGIRWVAALRVVRSTAGPVEPVRQRRQRRHAHRRDLAVGRDAVVGQAVPRREPQHRQLGREEPQRGPHRRQPGVVPADVHHRTAGAGDRPGEVACVESLGTAADEKASGGKGPELGHERRPSASPRRLQASAIAHDDRGAERVLGDAVPPGARAPGQRPPAPRAAALRGPPRARRCPHRRPPRPGEPATPWGVHPFRHRALSNAIPRRLQAGQGPGMPPCSASATAAAPSMPRIAISWCQTRRRASASTSFGPAISCRRTASASRSFE